eukprot:39382_1
MVSVCKMQPSKTCILNVPNFAFKIDCSNNTQLIKDIHHVANYLFPIHPSQYKISIIKEGYTNLLYLMTPNDNKHKKLLIRIYGPNTELFELIINRKSEETLFYELGQLEFGPFTYGTFTNGRIEQFYSNTTIELTYKQKYYKQIAETLALMHCLQPPSLQNKTHPSLWLNITKYVNIAGNVQFMDSESQIQKQYKALNWPNIRNQIDIMRSYLCNPDKLIEFIVSRNIFIDNSIVKIAYSFMFQSVLCHNDLTPENILYLPQYDEIKFIDFEYGSYNYRAFDFANHFCEYSGVHDNILDYNKFPERNHIKDFIKIYVDCLCNQYKAFVNKDVLSIVIKSRNSNNRYELFLNVCVDIVVSFCGVAHYFWGLWSILRGKYSKINFNVIKYAKNRLHTGYQHSLSIMPSYFRGFGRNHPLCKL